MCMPLNSVVRIFDCSENVELQRSRYHSGTSYISRASALERQGTDTYSKRYNYRSRSDVGSPRRYASQTLLDGARPGPTTPHNRRDALHSLQRELDSLSRSPDATRAGGYSSDTGYLDSRRRATGGYSSHDYGMPLGIFSFLHVLYTS